ncbi:ATP-binding protein [Microbacterium sp. JZ70]|uniref:sensor histidine kinase n=1 Tax=Microbacterium sp. JZ37 TaxID=2654193 RepID=UPI002B469353|nr:ATP-binding protein [Microbacterium sp. JZ37]WRH16887.1 ATP-binding protein [Microbacterium sp. JZ37]
MSAGGTRGIPSGQEAIAEAWTHVLPRRTATAVEIERGFTSARIERVLQIAVALASALLGVQSFLTAMGSDLDPLPRTLLTATVFASLAAMIAACLAGRWARPAATVFAFLFPLSLLLFWALPEPRYEPAGGPWVFFLLNVAPAAAALVFPVAWQLVWVVVVPLLFAIVRLSRGEFSAEHWLTSVYDVSLSLIVGGTAVALIWMFRSLAAGVDAARAAAIDQYSRAASAEAAEQERVEVAALMHDSVLAALIAAGRAQSDRERQLAVSMAREALTRLANAESDEPEGSDAPVTSAWIASELQAQARGLGVVLAVAGDELPMPGIPGRVARALVLAATQAVANSIQHADGRGLAVRLTARHGRIRIVVSDAGRGIDLASIPADRLGIRASIFARVAAVGGGAAIESDERGTVVTITWPAGDDDSLYRREAEEAP